MSAIDEAMTVLAPAARPDAPVTNRVLKAIIVAGVPLQIATVTRPRLGARLGLVPLDRPALGFVAALS